MEHLLKKRIYKSEVKTNEYNNQFIPQLNEHNGKVYLQCVVCGSKDVRAFDLFLENLVKFKCVYCSNEIDIDLVEIQLKADR